MQPDVDGTPNRFGVPIVHLRWPDDFYDPNRKTEPLEESSPIWGAIIEWAVSLGFVIDFPILTLAITAHVPSGGVEDISLRLVATAHIISSSWRWQHGEDHDFFARGQEFEIADPDCFQKLAAEMARMPQLDEWTQQIVTSLV